MGITITTYWFLLLFIIGIGLMLIVNLIAKDIENSLDIIMLLISVLTLIHLKWFQVP